MDNLRAQERTQTLARIILEFIPSEFKDLSAKTTALGMQNEIDHITSIQLLSLFPKGLWQNKYSKMFPINNATTGE
jgi:hypothetical protein